MSEQNTTLPPPDAPPTIGELVARISDQFSHLIRGELELAQANLKAKAIRLGAGGGMFAAAGVLALYAFGLILLGFAWLLGQWLPLWASLLIVAALLLLLAAVLGLIGKKQLDDSKKFQVDPATGIKLDVEAAKKGIQK
ncbi:MAG: phage holin family protein [Actinomycetales bacterium]|nr:phage holin family protein [Actinomycetales bacterium]